MGYPLQNHSYKRNCSIPDVEDLDDVDPAGTNQGLRLRYVFTQASRVFDMEGPLYADCFGLDKYLINGVDVQLRLFRTRPEFVLVSDRVPHPATSSRSWMPYLKPAKSKWIQPS